jgi:polysaccharide biosynthesis/export protein
MASLTTILLLLLSCAPQEPQDLNQQIQQRSFQSDVGALDYRVGPGDLIEIKVFGVDKFNQSSRVSASGAITVPYLGKVMAAGLTGAELERKLAEQITENKLILDPQVLVFVKEYQSQPVFIMGAVKAPGQYMITRSINLIDALAFAGGINQDRADDFLIVQRKVENSQVKKEKIVLKELLDNANQTANIAIRGGDVIQVPERVIQTFYIIGEVVRPGAYDLPKDREYLSMAQAIGRAGGPLKTAKLNGGILVRYEADGSRKEMAMKLDEIMKGKKPDLPVKADDVIFIPGSNIKTLGYGLIGALPGVATSTVSGAIIYH